MPAQLSLTLNRLWESQPGGIAMRLRFLGSWRSYRRPKPNKEILDQVVRRIVEVGQPDQIILFGSAARRQLRPDSDFDLLVVKSGITDARELKQKIQVHLFGIPIPIDIVVTTPEELHAARHKTWTLLGRVWQEGKRIYSVNGRRPQPRSRAYFRAQASR
jgi:predicted nucleotidyltransferase